jgi:serine/threonine protein kinase
LSNPSAETRIPTQTFLLPGQQFCIGLPWEREGLPMHGLPAALPKPPLAGAPLTLDATQLDADPCAGIEIGNCTVIRRLSPGDAKTLLAVREESGISTLVVMRRLDLPEHLLREIRAHAASSKKWQHPNLARVFDVESGDEGIFWISELASGATLAELAVAAKKAGRGMPLGLSLGAVYESALALQELHGRDVAHGLICDASVALSFDGTTRLLDAGLFGCIARNASWGEVLQPMAPYFAPEQVLRGYPPDPKCDVYSLGVVLYECLSGEKVRRGGFDAQVKQAEAAHWVPPSSFSVSLAPALTQVVLKALSTDRAQRYPDAAAFAKALREAAGAFVWRTQQRSSFVSELFELRKRREQVLLAALAEYKKNPTRPSLPLIKAASVEIPIIEGIELAELPDLPPPPPADALARPSARKLKKVKRKKGSLPAVTAFVASFSALFAVSSPVGLELLEPRAPKVVETIRALPPTPAQLARVPYLSSLFPPPAPVAVLKRAERAGHQ